MLSYNSPTSNPLSPPGSLLLLLSLSFHPILSSSPCLMKIKHLPTYPPDCVYRRSLYSSSSDVPIPYSPPAPDLPLPGSVATALLLPPARASRDAPRCRCRCHCRALDCLGHGLVACASPRLASPARKRNQQLLQHGRLLEPKFKTAHCLSSLPSFTQCYRFDHSLVFTVLPSLCLPPLLITPVSTPTPRPLAASVQRQSTGSCRSLLVDKDKRRYLQPASSLRLGWTAFWPTPATPHYPRHSTPPFGTACGNTACDNNNARDVRENLLEPTYGQTCKSTANRLLHVTLARTPIAPRFV